MELPRILPNKPTSTCDNPGPLSASSHQVCANSQRGATLEGLCALPGSPTSPVTRVVDERLNLDDDLMENLEVSALNRCGWDPGRDLWPALSGAGALRVIPRMKLRTVSRETVCACLCACAHTRMRTHVMFVCVYVCARVCMCVYVCMCVSVCLSVTHTHTHTHTNTCWSAEEHPRRHRHRRREQRRRLGLATSVRNSM